MNEVVFIQYVSIFSKTLMRWKCASMYNSNLPGLHKVLFVYKYSFKSSGHWIDATTRFTLQCSLLNKINGNASSNIKNVESFNLCWIWPEVTTKSCVMFMHICSCNHITFKFLQMYAVCCICINTWKCYNGYINFKSLFYNYKSISIECQL